MYQWADVEDLDDPTDPNAVIALETASWVLYKLTAEKYAGTKISTECYNTDTVNAYKPAVINGAMHNISSAGYNSTKLYLRRTPVVSITAVTVNGVVADPSTFQLRNNAYLTKTNRSSWDFSQEICVTYNHGTPPPTAGKLAAIRLANELILLMNDSEACSIPSNVTSISRNGMDFAMLDPQIFLDKGRTGIYAVDLFIMTANPSRARKKPQVYTPGKPRGERIR